jgi:hypothetical protein
MNALGKASQFAATASSTLAGGLDKLSNISIDSLAGQLKGSAGALAGQLQGQLTGQATALLNQAKGQATALLGQAQGQLNSLLSQGDSLVASVQQAAGFANTVNRATVDVAFTKILGSSKIPVPNFGAPDSASIAAALDISKAQNILKGLQGQGTALLNQAQGQAATLASQAQGVAGNLPVFSAAQVNRVL